MTENRSTTELDALVASADPLDATRAAGMPLERAQAELLEALIAQPREPAPGASPPPTRARRPRWGLVPRLSVAVAVVFAALMAVLSLTGGSADKSGTVWAAELVRFAEASPLVLLDVDGWRVDYADEQSTQEGELHFRRGPTPPPNDASTAEMARAGVPTTTAQLNWRGGSLQSWTTDRAASAKVRTRAPVLGTTARVYQYDGGRTGHQDITALFRYDGRVMEFRAGAADMAAFKLLLAGLRAVDTDTWLSAMPASVVKTNDRSAVVAEMLEGVSIPPGFDPASIKGAELTKDRYQLGAAVVGMVSCTWLKRWSDARAKGDQAGVREAVDAMAGSKRWPIVKEMAKSGAYPQVLGMLVAAMPTGSYYGRPLEGDADPALGCPALGIPLAAPGDRVNGG